MRAQLAARDRPPEEPDPELPGAGEPPSEPPTEAGSAEVIDDDSDAETLGFNEMDDGAVHPDQTDNDPYEEAEQSDEEELGTEDPEGSQAEARAEPDVTHVDIDESSEEAKEADTPEQPSQGEETPRTAIDATVASPTESGEAKERVSVPSKPYEFTGSIADWAKLKSSSAESKQRKSPPKRISS